MNEDASNYSALSVFMDHVEDFGVYRLPFLSNSNILKGTLKDRSAQGLYYREINPVVFEFYIKIAYVTLKLLTSRGYEHMWTLVINSEYRYYKDIPN